MATLKGLTQVSQEKCCSVNVSLLKPKHKKVNANITKDHKTTFILYLLDVLGEGEGKSHSNKIQYLSFTYLMSNLEPLCVRVCVS